MTNEDFAARITAMQGTLYRVTCSLLRQHADREDAVQSAIEKAWRKLGSLRDESRLQPWVVRILINECYAILRHQKRETPVEPFPDSPAPEGSDPDLYRFFTGLPDTLRPTMVLYYVEGYSTEEIAKMLSVPAGTVRSRLTRGREKLKTMMESEEAATV